MDELAEAYLAISGYMANLVAKKRQAPADDLISVLMEPATPGTGCRRPNSCGSASAC